MSELTIIIPAYNEEKSLKVFLPQVIAFCKSKSFKLIVVNDGSKDSTRAYLNEFTNENALLTVVNHKVNRGYGGAIKSGIRMATTKYVITIDADGQHLLEDIEKLYNYIISEDADMVVGSRAKQKDASFSRKIGKKIIRLIAKQLMPLKISDINSGMKIYTTEHAKNYINICPDSMAYSDIILFAYIYKKHLVLETPITIKPRLAGKSTISIKTAFDAIKEIMNIVMLFNPMRIFLPISLMFFFFGILWGVQFIIQGKGLSMGSGILFVMSLIIFLLSLIAEQLSTLKNNINK